MENFEINELKERLLNVISVKTIDIIKIYEELLSFFSESQENYIIRRQKELKKEGYINKEIFLIIIKEIKTRLFKGAELTERQIKRVLYKS